MESDGWKIISKRGQWQIVSIRTNQSTPLYEGMHRLICKLAWQYSRRCMLPIQDLISEGYIAILLAEDKYDPERAAKSTFVYWVVRNHFLRLRLRYLPQLEQPNTIAINPSPVLEDADEFRYTMSRLSREAKEIVKIICECPKELMELAKTGTPERLQNAIVKLLRRKRINGWTKSHIRTLFVEIKTAIQKL